MLSRNKEAFFANAMSWLLLQHGYSFHFVKKHVKKSEKTAKCFIWESLITPSGKIYDVSEYRFFLEYFIDSIQHQEAYQRSGYISNDFLQRHIDDKVVSAFKKALSDKYTIITSLPSISNKFH